MFCTTGKTTMDSDWNVRRKARGRIRRARIQRRRQRLTAAAIFMMLCLAVFAFGAVDYGEQRHIDIETAKKTRVSFSLPQIAPVLAQAGSSKPVDELPDLLPIKERFPDYRDVPKPLNPDDGNNGNEAGDPNESLESQLVILDDLRAAPPKSMFIDAIFENADSTLEYEGTVAFLSQDFTDPFPNLYGHPSEDSRMNNPPIPEPGTGILLALGLTAIATLQRRNKGPLPIASVSRSSANEGNAT
jgi:hypothetical protein